MDLANFPRNDCRRCHRSWRLFNTHRHGTSGSVISKAENRQKGLTPFEEVKDQIKEDALKETAQEVVKELREKAAVEFPAEVMAPAADTKVATPAVEAPKADIPAETKYHRHRPFGFWRIYVFIHDWIATGLFWWHQHNY